MDSNSFAIGLIAGSTMTGFVLVIVFLIIQSWFKE